LTDSTIYAHAVGRIRVIENRLLNRGTLERMIDAASPEDALKILIDAGYGSSGEEINIWNYEELLSNEIKEVYKLLMKISPDPVAIIPFLRKWDFHNSKVIIKGELSGTAYDRLLVDTGTIPAGTLVASIRDRNFKNLPASLSGAIKESIETYNKTGDPQLVDFIHDIAAHGQMLEDAEKTENDFVKGLFRLKTDFLNIKTFLRVKRTGGSSDYLKRVLMGGGALEPGFFLGKLDSPYEDFLASIKVSPYRELCEKAFPSFMSAGSLVEYERMTDDHMIGYIARSRYIAVGMEPLIAYLAAREIEITNVRIILVGKINNVPHESIRERLRRTYA
jgi:V/A-type H+-transporting ATPase subunit C